MPPDFARFKEICVFSNCGSVDFIIPPKTYISKTQSTCLDVEDKLPEDVSLPWLGMEDELIETIKKYAESSPEIAPLLPKDIIAISEFLTKSHVT